MPIFATTHKWVGSPPASTNPRRRRRRGNGKTEQQLLHFSSIRFFSFLRVSTYYWSSLPATWIVPRLDVTNLAPCRDGGESGCLSAPSAPSTPLRPMRHAFWCACVDVHGALNGRNCLFVSTTIAWAQEVASCFRRLREGPTLGRRKLHSSSLTDSFTRSYATF